MALTVTSLLSEWDDCNTDNWGTDPTVGLDTDFQIYETGCIGIDVDIETHHMFGTSMTSTDVSNNFIYAWMLSFSASTLDTKSAGGMRICVEDSSGNQSYWYVGGSDTYTGGWEVFVVSTARSPDANNGTNATLTDIVKFGVGFKNTAKSKLTQNCFVDWMRYGTAAALKITGTNTTANAGWSEVLSGDTTGVFGIIKAQKGGYVLKGPIEIGDSSGTATTDFTDTGSLLVWDDLPVGDSHYKISVLGNSTGTTDVQIGSVVGSGDDRQGVQGNNISTAGPAWAWDSQTDIADLDSVQLYGCSFIGAHAGMLFDGMSTAANSSIISCNFINCGAVETGATSNGVEILNSFFIDPEGTTNNYGLQFDQTPSVGVMTTNVKQCGFITSGTPTTQYMTVFPYTGDYSVDWADMTFFGSYTSGTLWHGLNTGTNADVVIAATGSTNAADAEFSSTAGGTVDVQASVSVTITVKDVAGAVIQNAQVYVLVGASVLINADTNASGIASANYTGTTPASATVWIRKASSGATKYKNYSSVQTIASGTGLTLTVTLVEDPNNNATT